MSDPEAAYKRNMTALGRSFARLALYAAVALICFALQRMAMRG